jgi:hypothetical protein
MKSLGDIVAEAIFLAAWAWFLFTTVTGIL